ncbi:M20/M25/M40 family metallo-hydrolase [Novosphingobium sp. BL-52-GroH]|uniref:M20/M25/M40 family metallo-hydrolase n=1 Tax=Novosphingobium sp. BL-52-GroH TaxID=3349877 RepID=UPI00384FB94F
MIELSRRFPLLTLAALLAASVPASAATEPDGVNDAARAVLPQFLEFLAIPNVTARSSAEIRNNATWLEARLKTHGWASRLLPDGQTPMVWASYEKAGPKAPTVLFYAHMDGQPVNNAEWDQPDPFIPVLRECKAGTACADVPTDRLNGHVDPDLRLFARSSSDDKGPIMMLVAAVDALRKEGRRPAVNIRLIVDSHEEGGPDTLGDVIRANAADLAADTVVILDGPMHPSNRPTVVYGHRGGGVLSIVVHGPSHALHSGHYGNFVPNPAQNLARLLASLKDEQGRVAIPGYYEGADPAFTAAIGTMHAPDDEAGLLHGAGVAKAERFVASYRDAVSRPSLNLIGLDAGTGRALDRSIIPVDATAAFDLRTVPGITFEAELARIRAFVALQGYHLVDGEPTQQDRATYPLLASVSGRPLSDALFTDPRSTAGQWVRAALGDAFGTAPVEIPIMGGSVPSGPLARQLKVPLILLPLVNADNNQHAANENLRLGNFFDGVKSLHALLSRRP